MRATKLFAHLNERAEEVFAKYLHGTVLDWRLALRREFVRSFTDVEVGQPFEFELPIGPLKLKAEMGVKKSGRRLIVIGQIAIESDVPFAEVIDLKVVDQEEVVSPQIVVAPLEQSATMR